MPRYYWGDAGGLSVKDVLVPLVERAAAEGGIDVRLGHEAVGLRTDDQGAITGIEARDPAGQTIAFHAANVVLACGGYAGNPQLFEALNGAPQYNASPYPCGQGAGIKLGQSVGGYVRGRENQLINFGTLFDTDQFPAMPIARIEHFPDLRPLWEIYVNAAGARFVREDIDSVDAREMALSMQPDQRYWVIFDSRILAEAPAIVVGWSPARIREEFDKAGPTFVTAPSIDELAAKAGIDATGLAQSIRGFNYGVLTGADFLGRAHHSLPIAEAPFHAIRTQASSIVGAAGLTVDSDLRVIRGDGTPIRGLYAAGEVLGSSQTMGQATSGGMMVTPAMTFGRLLGESLIPLESQAGSPSGRPPADRRPSRQTADTCGDHSDRSQKIDDRSLQRP